MHPMELLDEVYHMESHFSLVGDRCMVCAQCTIGLETIVEVPDGTPSEEAQVKAYFGLFGDSANLDAR